MHFVYDDAQIFIEFLLIDLEAINLLVTTPEIITALTANRKREYPPWMTDVLCVGQRAPVKRKNSQILLTEGSLLVMDKNRETPVSARL